MTKFYTLVLSVCNFQSTYAQHNGIKGTNLTGTKNMRKRIIYPVAMFLLMSISSYGQDPSFSQFFSSPLNINPALTANINTDWRVISNIRNQWVGLASPYATGTLCFDSKVLQKKYAGITESN